MGRNKYHFLHLSIFSVLRALLLLLPCLVYAQKADPYFLHYNEENGLPTNSPITAIKDSRGYLWVGTNAGLCRFNGIEFLNFKQNAFIPENLESDYIKGLFEDSDQLIWITSKHGHLISYDFRQPSSNQFKIYDSPDAPAAGRCIDVCEDSNKNIWINSTDGNFYVYHKQSLKFEKFHVGNADTSIFRHSYFLKKFLSDQLLYFNPGSGLFTLNIRNLKKKQIENSEFDAYLKSADFKAFYVQKQEKDNRHNKAILYVLNSRGIIIVIDMILGRVIMKKQIPFNLHENYRCIIADNNKNLWIGGDKGGVIYYDNLKNEFHKIIRPFFHPYENRMAEFYNFYCDPDGIVLMMSRSGLYVKNDLLNKFENFTVKQYELNYNHVLNVQSFCKLNDSILLIGTNEGLHILNEKTNIISIHRFDEEEKNVNQWQLKKFANGRIFMNSRGIQELDLRKWKLNNLEIICDTSTRRQFMESAFNTWETDTIDGEEVWYLCSWSYTGLFLYFTKSKKLQHLGVDPHRKNMLPNGFMRGFVRDSKGRIYTGLKFAGLCRIDDFSEGRYKIFSHSETDTLSIPKGNVEAVLKDKNDNIWLLIDGFGLAKLIEKNGKLNFERYSSGLYSNFLMAGIIDDQNRIWLSSTAGIEQFDIATKRFVHFGRKDGIYFPRFGEPYNTDENQNIYFGSWPTFVRFDPKMFKPDEEASLLHIGKFTVMENDSTHLVYNQKIVLPHNKNFISFTLEDIHFTNSNSVIYKYKLEGLDKEWIFSDTRNYVSYPDLSPGNYTFYYTSAFRNGIWKNEIKKIQIIILAAWWQSKWLPVLVVLFFISLLYFIYRIRLNQLLKIESVRNKIARDLHDDLGATLSSISLYSEAAIQNLEKKDAGRAEEILKIIGQNSREMVEDMSDIVWAVNPANDKFERLIARLESFGANLFGFKDISFQINLDEELKRVHLNMTQRKNLFLICKEALNNAAKYSECRNIIIEFRKNRHDLEVKISDDGTGFDLQKETKGNGLKNIRSRAEEMKAALILTSKNNQGTELFIKIKS